MPEFDLIEKYLKPLARDQAALGLTDDAAILNSSHGCSLVLSKDMMVEGVHYSAGTPPKELAKKLLRVNLSDLAAMGATPKGYLLGLSLPTKFTTEQSHNWLSAFAQGLAEDQKLYNISLLGGDTVAVEGKAVLSLTIIGEVPVGNAIKRTGAKAGDVIMVTGSLGDAALALNIEQQNGQIADQEKQYLLDRLHLPQPRVGVGMALRGLVNAAVDVSDGLLADLSHITDGSHVGADIYLDSLPLSAAAEVLKANTKEKMKNFWPFIYGGGDDYELVITAPPSKLAIIKDTVAGLGVALSEIGIVKAGKGVNLLDKDGNEVSPLKSGYEHFAK